MGLFTNEDQVLKKVCNLSDSIIGISAFKKQNFKSLHEGCKQVWKTKYYLKNRPVFVSTMVYMTQRST